jgi:hypothetical protein
MSLSLSDFGDLLDGDTEGSDSTELGDSLSASVDVELDSMEAVREIREDV